MIISIIKTCLEFVPWILISRILHLLFLGPVHPEWSIQYTIVASLLTYLFDIFPTLGVYWSRRIIDTFPIMNFWEANYIQLSLPYAHSKTKGFLHDFAKSKPTASEGISAQFMMYKRQLFEAPVTDLFKAIYSYFYRESQPNEAVMKFVNDIRSQSTSKNEGVILYLHGGAYIAGSVRTHRFLCQEISKHTNLPLLIIDYGLAPENQFPTPLFDAFSAYCYLTDKENGLGYRPDQIFIAGDSAGGNLTLSLAYYLRDFGFDKPRGYVLLSPWLDLTQSSPKWRETSLDYVKVKTSGGEKIGDFYAPNRLYNPYVSPLYGNVDDLGSILIQYGDMEVLSDEIKEYGEKFSNCKNTCLILENYLNMVHVFHVFHFDEQSRLAFTNIRKFIDQSYENELKPTQVTISPRSMKLKL